MTTPLPQRACAKATRRRSKGKPLADHAPHEWIAGVYLPVGECDGYPVRCPGYPPDRPGGAS